NAIAKSKLDWGKRRNLPTYICVAARIMLVVQYRKCDSGGGGSGSDFDDELAEVDVVGTEERIENLLTPAATFVNDRYT
ncbi:hypothetical protein U1Q18_052088, partial [Sarracenia purpurea var. burkii]